MQFEWDTVKAQINFFKHGIDFETATLVFLDEHKIERHDTRYIYDEYRWIVIGLIVPTVVIVVYTDRNDVTRIISARKANEQERAEYYNIQH